MKEYDDVLKEKNQNKRIEIVLTDAYREDEMQSAFCCYLEDNIKFPFEAKIRGDKKSKRFTVLRFTSLTPHRIVCEIEFEERIKSRMPLTEIELMDKKSPNNIVISDYLKFINESYE